MYIYRKVFSSLCVCFRFIERSSAASENSYLVLPCHRLHRKVQSVAVPKGISRKILGKPFLFFCIMIQAQELRRYDPLTSASSIDSGSRAASLRPFDFCFFHCDLLSLLFLFVALRRVRRYDSLEPLTQCRIKEKCVKLWVVSRRHRLDIGGIVRHACGRSFPSFMLRSRRSVASRTRSTGR